MNKLLILMYLLLIFLCCKEAKRDDCLNKNVKVNLNKFSCYVTVSKNLDLFNPDSNDLNFDKIILIDTLNKAYLNIDLYKYYNQSYFNVNPFDSTTNILKAKEYVKKRIFQRSLDNDFDKKYDYIDIEKNVIVHKKVFVVDDKQNSVWVERKRFTYRELHYFSDYFLVANFRFDANSASTIDEILYCYSKYNLCQDIVIK